MEQRRHGRSRLRPVAVFRFLSEDWSPWIALVRMRERWPGLRFDMKAGYLQVASLRLNPRLGLVTFSPQRGHVDAIAGVARSDPRFRVITAPDPRS